MPQITKRSRPSAAGAVGALVALALALVGALLPSAATAADREVETLAPSQASFTSAHRPEVNFSSSESLVATSAAFRSFLEFDGIQVPEGQRVAELALLVDVDESRATVPALQVSKVDGSWDAGTITDENRPDAGVVLSEPTLAIAGETMSVPLDVDEVMASGGPFSIELRYLEPNPGLVMDKSSARLSVVLEQVELSDSVTVAPREATFTSAFEADRTHDRVDALVTTSAQFTSYLRFDVPEPPRGRQLRTASSSCAVRRARRPSRAWWRAPRPAPGLQRHSPTPRVRRPARR
ncbi:hypothetical protein GCM10025865_20460 [Paraoerskovia sediminicola]|uniref:Carbohydrate-binding module family 96 domain-containing protein n=2 Tax=Paraoerskovia sediminicola TaxID=1138587 RepID=A0ABN6XD05_9CELL|nr:hypothetical protein GCM10025865_20460 [Paraoerskovia sediminicola]